MKAADFDINIINQYFEMLKNLSKPSKEILITKLINSIESEKKDNTHSIKNLFGAFKSDKSADELIDDIRKSRTFNRTTEKFE
jgi:hypothetical protein